MEQLPFSANVAIAIVALWTIPWKIYAVWTAIKKGHNRWFVVLIILNTLSILELVYLFFVAKKKWPEVKSDFRKAWHSLK